MLNSDLRSKIQDVCLPLGEASGLPNGCYTDPDYFEFERREIFGRNWSCIGFTKDVPENGDAMPVTHAGVPLVILTDHAGIIRVFQNVCRHRGITLIDEPGKFGSVIRCRYHGWCYGLDGALRGMPDAGGPGIHTSEHLDRSELGLFTVRSHEYLGAIFVDLSGDAPVFNDYSGDLPARWAEFSDRPLYHSGADSSFKLTVKSNWKLAVENYCESYHLPQVHPELNKYSRIEDHYHIMKPGNYSGQGTTVYSPLLDSNKHFRSFSGLTNKWDESAEYIALYPNVLLGVHRDHTFAIRLEAVGPQETVEHVEIYYADESSVGPEYEALRARNTAQWKQVFQEDVFAVEGMQRGRHASAFDGGQFAPVMDAPTHVFSRLGLQQSSSTPRIYPRLKHHAGGLYGC